MVFLDKITLSYNTEDFRDTETYRVMLDRKVEVTLTTDNCEDKDDGYLYLDVGKVYGTQVKVQYSVSQRWLVL